MFEIASHGKNEEILMAVLPCKINVDYKNNDNAENLIYDLFNDDIDAIILDDNYKDYADEQYAESCKEWSAFAEHKCAGLSVANKKYLADIFEKASLLELAFWKMAYRNERME